MNFEKLNLRTQVTLIVSVLLVLFAAVGVVT